MGWEKTDTAMPNKPQLRILWQNEDLIAIAKPAGMPTIPGRDGSASVLETLAAEIGLPAEGKRDPRLRVLHRLDRDTSGVLLFAKNIDAQRHLSRQFKANTVTKEYLALVSGRPPEKQGEIDAPLSRHPTRKTRMAIAAHGGRPARTLWQIEETFRDYTLLRVFPKTGKTHQIRVHLRSIGLPLAIDPIYNPGRAAKSTGIYLSRFKRSYSPTHGEDERPLIDRLPLHAERLSFLDRLGNGVTVECELPKDFRAVLNQLRKWGR